MYLMVASPLFVLAASSPRLGHRRWINQKEGSQQFVLNPPRRDELIKVLVRSSFPPSLLTLFSLSMTFRARNSGHRLKVWVQHP